MCLTLLLGLLLVQQPRAARADDGWFGRFNANAVGNDWSNAYLLAYLSHYVYPGEVGVPDGDFAAFANAFPQHFQGSGLTITAAINVPGTDTQATVGETADAVIVTFRGTSNAADGAVDAMANATPGGIHLGFAWAAASALPQIYDAVKPAVDRGKKLWLTGHSLGGALAQVTGLFLDRQITEDCVGTLCIEGASGYERITPQGIVTFGSPRPFTALLNTAGSLFAATFAPPSSDPETWKAQRWVNNLDPVPHVPPLGYNEFGKLRLIKVTNNMCTLTSPNPYDILLPDVDDHDTRRYVNRIMGLMPPELRSVLPELPRPSGTANCDDGTPPHVSSTVTGTPASGFPGWYTGNVSVNWSVDDPQSQWTADCPSVTISSDTPPQGTVVSCTAASLGGTRTESLTIRRDSSPPVVTPSISGTQGNGGWYIGDALVTWGTSDPHSPASTCSSTTISTDTSGTTVQCTSSSAGGSTTSSVTVRRDATVPTVTCPVAPQFLQGATDALLHATANDAMSGQPGNGDRDWDIPVAVPGTGLAQIGTYYAPAQATDGAGNSANVACAYRVVWKIKASETDTILVGDVRPSGSGAVNTLPAGKPVRVQFDLGGNRGMAVLASGYPKTAPTSCDARATADPVTVMDLGNQTLSYDPATGLYSYPWKTDPAWKGTCRQLVLLVADGNEYRADFKFS